MLICLPLLVTVCQILRLILMPSHGTNSLEGSLRRSEALGQPLHLLKKSKANRKEAPKEEIRQIRTKEEKRKAKVKVSLKPLKLLLKRMRWTSLVMTLRLTLLLPKL